jgi:hypothetical protein
MLTKIAEMPRPCLHPEHNPPSNIVLDPGVYQHTCPACGRSITFTVHSVVCSVRNDPIVLTTKLSPNTTQIIYNTCSPSPAPSSTSTAAGDHSVSSRHDSRIAT